MINAILYKEFFFCKNHITILKKARKQNAEFTLNFYNS